MDERECVIALNLVDTIGGERLASLIERFGSAREALLASEAQLRTVEGIGPVTARKIAAVRDGKLLREELRTASKLGVKIVTSSDPGYPERLHTINHPPPVLYVKGTLLPSDAFSLAIVGSRRGSHYGRRAARLLSSEAAAAGLTVVSGMARGIDSVAHHAALERGGRTIAVLGCGIDVVYPPENVKLAQEIAGNGALVSERSLGTRPLARNFPARNRIISGLSLGVVVVEAGETSGSLITAEFAADQGREVFAVPGDIESPLSRGTHRLIKEGARLVEGIADVLDELGIEVPRGDHRGTMEGESSLSARERRVLAVMGFSPVSADDIVYETGLAPQDVAVALGSLELRGIVERSLDGYARRS
ncbi:MAG: DNA-processing protein DprA [Firmicutes bacterium]|nr:DNA-processing protein DprA [Bacillota bacterium]MDH7494924.1 DNA-processing protein DprA [Bacillota bacterium]